ncbi:MAG: ATP-binding protein [Steroidobacteraceae bacterium]
MNLGALRVKLAATAVASFVLTGLMAVLVLRTTREAERLGEQVHASHERMQLLARLQYTASRLQQLTHRDVRAGTAQSATQLRAARQEFIGALAALRANARPSAMSRALGDPRAVQRLALAGLGLALGVCAACFALLLARFGPGLKRLETAARAFGSGDLAHRVSLRGRDELSRLAAGVNSMAQALADQQTALQEHRAGLERAVSARTAELERANAALCAQDARRRTFLADASHELRMPLTIIRGEAQVALREGDDRSSPGASEALERILEQTRVLTRLLEDLFLIARAEAGGLPLSVRAVDLGELVRRVAHDFATLACESGATVRADAQGALIAHVDPDRIRQALVALIDNALRHTRPGVAIHIGARSERDWIAITVTDDGPGVDPIMAAGLFGRFRRGRTRSEGSGLGLSVVRALAEAHGGTASLGNGARGGACAVVKLPRRMVPPAARAGRDIPASQSAECPYAADAAIPAALGAA